MSVDFEAFARVATTGGRIPPVSRPVFRRFTVLGGGEDARLLAALCVAAGGEAILFSAYGAELEMLRQSSGITLRSAGPVGSYHVDRDAPSINTTAELDAATRDAEVVFLTGPLHKQRTYAMVLADHLQDGQVLVLAPGRSLGAVETAWLLRVGGCRADVTIAEWQGLPFWIDAQGSHLTLSDAPHRSAATLPRGREEALDALIPVLGPCRKMESVLASGFADLSAAVEIPALVLGGAGLASGGMTIPMGGTPLPENATFASLVGPDQRSLIAALAEERRAVARAFGVRDLPALDDWIADFAGAARGQGARPIPRPNTARQIMRDGVIGSLVPLVSSAETANTPVPRTRSLVTLTECILGADVAAAGRRLETIGITECDLDSARRAFDTLVTGAR